MDAALVFRLSIVCGTPIVLCPGNFLPSSRSRARTRWMERYAMSDSVKPKNELRSAVSGARILVEFLRSSGDFSSRPPLKLHGEKQERFHQLLRKARFLQVGDVRGPPPRGLVGPVLLSLPAPGVSARPSPWLPRHPSAWTAAVLTIFVSVNLIFFPGKTIGFEYERIMIFMSTLLVLQNLMIQTNFEKNEIWRFNN